MHVARRRSQREGDRGLAGVGGQQAIAAQGLARRVDQQRLGGIPGALHQRGGGVDSDVANHLAVIRVAQRICDVHHGEAGILGRRKIAHVHFVAGACDLVHVAEREHVGRVTDVIVGHDRRPRQERGDGGIGNGRDGALERRAAQTRIQAHRTGLLEAHLRTAVGTERQRQRVTRINDVRIRNLRIDDPHLGPQPRIAQVHRGDAPERVAAFDRVVLGRTGLERRAGLDRRGGGRRGAGARGGNRRLGRRHVLLVGYGARFACGLRHRGRGGGGGGGVGVPQMRAAAKGDRSDQPARRQASSKYLIRDHPPLLIARGGPHDLRPRF